MSIGEYQGMIPGPGGLLYPLNINQRLFPPNQFNDCLDRECQKLSFINDCGGLIAICPGRKWEVPPWVRMPQQGKRFMKPFSLSLPAADGADHLIGSFFVPVGMDGCITSPVLQTDGVQNFQDGSGDLTWRIQINQRWVKDYGAVTIRVANFQTPLNINSGQILLQSNQLVQFWVNRSTTSNISGGRVLAGAFGWWWPR